MGNERKVVRALALGAWGQDSCFGEGGAEGISMRVLPFLAFSGEYSSCNQTALMNARRAAVFYGRSKVFYAFSLSFYVLSTVFCALVLSL